MEENAGALCAAAGALTGARAELVDQCRRFIDGRARAFASGLYWNAAHAAGYFIDAPALRARTEREAVAAYEARWQALGARLGGARTRR